MFSGFILKADMPMARLRLCAHFIVRSVPFERFAGICQP
jgi:hypothetical protein